MSKPKKMLDERIAELYYTATEAQTALGMNKATFNYWVKTGKIKKRSILGGKQGFYPKKDIDALAAEIEAILIADTPPPFTFRRATMNDMADEDALAHLVFGQPSDKYKEMRRAYLQANQDSFWHLYDQDRLVSFISLFPFKDEAYTRFLQGTGGWLLGIENVEQFAPGPPLNVVIIDFVSTPAVQPKMRSQYASRVLVELGRVLVEWGRMGIEIRRIAAASATESGQRLLKNAGFEVVGDSGHNRLIYEVDLEHTDRRIYREYKQALAEYKAAQQQA